MISLLALEDRYLEGWPAKEDPRAATVLTLEQVLTEPFDTDAHFTAYRCALEYRHTNASLTRADEAGIEMVAAVFDVDGPEHKGDDAWWASAQPAIAALRAAHPCGFVYRTRGGYRIVYALPDAVPIRAEADAQAWSAQYLAWCGYLERAFGIVADRACKGWHRLFRAPRVVRDGARQEFETIGEPGAVGAWAPALETGDWAPALGAEPEEAAHTTTPSSDLRDDAAQLLANRWPESGSRIGARLALVGACYHAGWSREAAADFAMRVHARIPNRGDVSDAVLRGLVDATFDRGASGQKISGWRVLGEYVGPAIAQSARDLLRPDAAAEAAFLQMAAGEPEVAPAPNKPADGIFWDNWDEPVPPVDWLVHGLIPAGTVGGFVALGSSLKTWAALSLGACIAKGKPWLGKFPVKTGKVVLVDYESGRYELRRRVLMLEGGKVVGLGAWSYPNQTIDDPALWVELGNTPDIVLVVIDSLAAGSSPEVDENAKAASYPLKLAAHFTEATGAAVLFIHHSKKTEGGDARNMVRGSSAVFAAMDWCFAFENVEENSARRRMLMTNIKPCMGPKPEPVPLELTDKGLTTFDLTEKATKASPPEQIQAAVRLTLAGGAIESKAKIASQIGVRREIVTPEIDAMIVRGEVVFLKGQGFALDSDSERRKRVCAIVDGYQHWRGEGQLAKAANVDTATVGMCLREGLICKSGDGRYLVVRQERVK